MDITPENFSERNRDHFLLSKGHCVDALYMVLGDLGFFDKEEAKKTFFAYGSRYLGHPNTEVPGIEINSGSLGHGMALGVGMALAGKMDGMDYRTYVVLGDGEMAEGIQLRGHDGGGTVPSEQSLCHGGSQRASDQRDHRRGHEHCGSGKEI